MRYKFALLLVSLLVFSLGSSVFAQGLTTTDKKEDWEEINFVFDSAILTDGYPSLLKLADLLNQNPEYRVKLDGHTDFLGSDNYNDKLGAKRAETVRDFERWVAAGAPVPDAFRVEPASPTWRGMSVSYRSAKLRSCSRIPSSPQYSAKRLMAALISLRLSAAEISERLSTVAASSASSFEPKKNPASAVTTIRNGNRAISADNAIWLAIAQPSSAMKRRKASAASRNDRLRTRNRCSRRRQSLKSSIVAGFASPFLPYSALREKNYAACTLLRNWRTCASRPSASTATEPARSLTPAAVDQASLVTPVRLLRRRLRPKRD